MRQTVAAAAAAAAVAVATVAAAAAALPRAVRVVIVLHVMIRRLLDLFHALRILHIEVCGHLRHSRMRERAAGEMCVCVCMNTSSRNWIASALNEGTSGIPPCFDSICGRGGAEVVRACR